jgi:hypothetical protein
MLFRNMDEFVGNASHFRRLRCSVSESDSRRWIWPMRPACANQILFISSKKWRRLRIDAVKEKFGAAVRIENRFCSVFGDTAGKITSTWKDRGGYEGFNSHLRQIAERFPHIEIHPEIWLNTRPSTSASAHLFMTAVQQWEHQSGITGGQSAATIFDQVM